MDDILVGLVVLVLGALVCFAGLRVFFIALPIWGFFAGFYAGAAGIQALFGDGFLSTGTSWVIGFFVGILFAVLSYLFWYVGAVIAAGSVGAMIGSGLMAAFNVDTGWIVFIVAAFFAVVVALFAMLFAVPVFVVLISTAFAGAAAITTGLLLLLNQFEVDDLGYGAAWAMINDSWFWTLLWLGFAGLGCLAQVRSVAEAVLPGDRWSRTPYVASPAP